MAVQGLFRQGPQGCVVTNRWGNMTVPGGVVELVELAEFDGILGEVDLNCKTESTELNDYCQ